MLQFCVDMLSSSRGPSYIPDNVLAAMVRLFLWPTKPQCSCSNSFGSCRNPTVLSAVIESRQKPCFLITAITETPNYDQFRCDKQNQNRISANLHSEQWDAEFCITCNSGYVKCRSQGDLDACSGNNGIQGENIIVNSQSLSSELQELKSPCDFTIS